MALSAPGGLIAGFRHSAQRRLSAVRVLVALTDQGVTCAWQSKGQWVWVDAEWPPGACIQGRPQQSEAMADLIADLLLDLGLIGARVELLLPLALCQWRVIDGLAMASELSSDHALVRALSWSLDPEDCYISNVDCFGSQLLVGLPRSSLQLWIDVFEQADLALDRVDWILSAAWRGVLKTASPQNINLAWIIGDRQQRRLVLLREGVPEVDQLVGESGPQWLMQTCDLVQAWHQLNPGTLPLKWLLTAPPSAGLPLTDLAQQGMDVTSTEPSVLMRYDALGVSSEPVLLDPLISLGFEGLGLARRS